MNDIFNEMLSRYTINTDNDRRNAIYEVMQQVALAGLYQGGFFDHAAFYGGTCLRIFHQINRFVVVSNVEGNLLERTYRWRNLSNCLWNDCNLRI